jgi:CBS domain containing-hemolysin-like protein
LDESLLPRFFALIFLWCLSGFFSACEAAFFSLGPLQLSNLKETKGRTGALINSLLADPRRLLITIYIGNEMVNVAAAAVTTSLAIALFGSVGVGVAIGAGTFILLLFGEILPKTLALRSAETFSLFAAFPLKLFHLMVQPAERGLHTLAEKFLVFCGFSPVSTKPPPLTDEEFRAIVNLGEDQGVLESDERAIIHNIIEFSDKTAANIMTPKIEMFTLNEDDTLDEVLPKIVQNFYSRVPVYDKANEHIVGILYTKDLNRLKETPNDKFSLKGILWPAIFVPESKKIKELLEDFKNQKKHLAIVLDEYGSVAGVVTLEDILEELVGEIDSEMRPEENRVKKIGPNTYRLPATFHMSDFNREFESQLPEDTFETVGGLVFDLFGRVPRFGEAVTHGHFKFLVEKMKGPRIISLQITLLAEEGAPAPNNGGNRN